MEQFQEFGFNLPETIKLGRSELIFGDQVRLAL
jgi:hypothetical protein